MDSPLSVISKMFSVFFKQLITVNTINPYV